jgi:hypothetical protein
VHTAQMGTGELQDGIQLVPEQGLSAIALLYQHLLCAELLRTPVPEYARDYLLVLCHMPTVVCCLSTLSLLKQAPGPPVRVAVHFVSTLYSGSLPTPVSVPHTVFLSGLGFLSWWLLGQTRAFVSPGRAWAFVVSMIPFLAAIVVGITRITGTRGVAGRWWETRK